MPNTKQEIIDKMAQVFPGTSYLDDSGFLFYVVDSNEALTDKLVEIIELDFLLDERRVPPLENKAVIAFNYSSITNEEA